LSASSSQLWGGGFFDPFDPDPDRIRIDDIAHALSLQCRFNGHTRVHYSVAEHCVRVSRMFRDAAKAQWGLMHDAPEWVLGDLSGPLKHTPFGDAYRELEDRLMEVIAAKYGLEGTRMPPDVKQADRILLITERRDLLGYTGTAEELAQWAPWSQGIEPLATPIRPWTAEYAEEQFQEEFAIVNLMRGES
jgi:hypothetical protein